MALAIFDLDNTLINGDSDHAWGEYLIECGLVDGDYYQARNDGFYKAYQSGELDIHEYLEFALEPLARLTKAQLNVLHQGFMFKKIKPMQQPKAKALLNKHRQQGDVLLIITATNRFVTEPIAKELGVENLLASDLEIIEGRITGKPLGIPCFQEGKVLRLEQWLDENRHSMAGSYFYSDSHNDIPLLKRVDNPIAVDADDTLYAYAKDMNWPRITLRKA